MSTRAALPAALGVLLVAGAFAWSDVWAADVWWQLATGRWIVENGRVPHEDPFSWTTAGRTWVEPRWGYEVLLHLLHEKAGAAGLVAAKTACLLAAFALAATAARPRRAPGLASLAAGLAVVAASERFRVRPEVATYLLFAATLWILERSRRDGRVRRLVVVPVLAAVWANLHSLPFLGPGLAVLYGAGAIVDRRRGRGRVAAWPFLAAGAAGAAALFLNPYGAAAAVELPWTLFREIRAGHVYAEWITEFLSPWDPRVEGFYLHGFVPLLAIVPLAALPSIRRLPTAHAILVAAFGYLAVVATRNVPLFALAALPVAATAFERLARFRAARLVDRGLLVLVPVASVAIAALVATDRWYVAEGTTRRFGAGLSDYQYPIGAARFVLEERPPGRGFSSLSDSSYLIWQGLPVFADGRLELHDVSTFETYLDVARGEIDPDGAPDLAGVRWCLVDHNGLQPLVARLARRGSPWRLVYVDGLRAVYVREGPDTAAWLEDLRARRIELPVEDLAAARAETPGAVPVGVLSYRLGWFWFRVDRPERAIEAFERADSIRAIDPLSRLRLAECYVDRGARERRGEDLDRAREHLERVVGDAPDLADARRWLGLVAWVHRRDRDGAIRHYREYFRLGGDSEEARRELRALESLPAD